MNQDAVGYQRMDGSPKSITVAMESIADELHAAGDIRGEILRIALAQMIQVGIAAPARRERGVWLSGGDLVLKVEGGGAL